MARGRVYTVRISEGSTASSDIGTWRGNEPTGYTTLTSDDYADATTLKGSGGHKLGDVAVTSGDFPSIVDNTEAAGGRKIPSFTESVTPDEGGSADHLALVDDANSILLHVDTMTPTSVTAAEQQSVEVGEIINEDPT